MWSVECGVSSHLTTCQFCHAICTLSPLDATLAVRFAQNTQQHTFKLLRVSRKMTMDVSKVLRLPRKMHLIFLTTTPKYCACHTKTAFYIFADTCECHEAPCPPRKMTLQPVWKPSKRRGFAASPIDTARPEENQRLETRHMLEHQNEHFVRDFLQFSYFVASKSMFPTSFPNNKP